MKMIEKLIKAAKGEDWNFIDTTLPLVSNNPKFIDWAINKGLDEKNGNIRDLAVSLLEKTRDLDERSKEKLFSLMSNDSNPYVRFRSAFALKSHNYDKHTEEVIKVLKQAAQDPDVKKIADAYLKN